jgi:hypothetical protein
MSSMLLTRVDPLRRAGTTADTILSADQREQFSRVYRELFPRLFGFVHFRVRDQHAAEDVTARVFERALAGLAAVRDPSGCERGCSASRVTPLPTTTEPNARPLLSMRLSASISCGWRRRKALSSERTRCAASLVT